MKKIVPDPPRNIIATSHYTLHSHLSPQDSLAYASELLRSVYETTEEYCRLHFKDPGQGMLVNVLNSAETAKSLIEHALTKLQGSEPREVSA